MLLTELISAGRHVLQFASSVSDEKRVGTLLAVLRAYAVAISVDPVKRVEIDALKRAVLPPRKLDDVQLIASLGDEIIDDLPEVVPDDAEAAKAYARILAQIGTAAAVKKAQLFLRERRTAVLPELFDLVDPLELDYVRNRLASGATLEPYLAERISRISDASKLGKVKRIDLSYFGISDFSFLEKCEELESLKLRRTKMFDPAPLVRLKKLRYLDISGTFVTEFDFLANLIDLEVCNVSDTPAENLNVLAQLPKIRYLASWNTDVDELSELLVSRVDKVYTNSRELLKLLPKTKVMGKAG